MFENITAEVLNRLLGSYVSPSSFQADRVSTSVYKGHVLLSRLELRADALDRLLLPVSLKKGLIMKAEISIPWTQLGSKPVEIVLDGVYLLLNPKTDWSEDELERRAQASKAAKLVQAELVKRSREAMMGLGRLVDGSAPDASFTSRLMGRVTDNVEMRLKNVHIRFEDSVTYCFGMTLECLSVQTTDSSWNPRFKENAEAQTYKLCRMERFSVYADPPSAVSSTFSLFGDSETEFIKFFSTTMSHTNDTQNHAYIIRPMDASLRIVMHREQPLTKFDFFCKSLDIRLETFQVTHFLTVAKTLSKATSSISSQIAGMKRPLASPMQDPRGWWAYAISFAIKTVKEKRYKWSRAYFIKRRRDRLEYTLLWKRYLVGGPLEDNTRNYTPLSSQDKIRIEWLEKCLEFNDIMLFRSYAENELRLEKAHQELWELGVAKTGSSSTQGMPMSSSNAAVASGWISWALGMSSSSNNAGLKESLSQQDVERFLALLKHNPAVTVLEKDASESVVSAIWTFQVPRGSLFFNPIRMSFEGVSLDLTTRLDHSSAISLALDGLVIYDGFRRILGPRGEFFAHKGRQRSASMDDLDMAAASMSNSFAVKTLASLDLAEPTTPGGNGASPKKRNKSNSLIYLKADTNPSQTEIDQSYHVKIGALEFIHSPTLIVKLAELVNALPSSSSSTAVASAASTLPAATRNAVAVELDIRSPLLVVPSGLNSSSSALIVDLGRFSIQDQALRTKAQVALALESKNLQDERLFDNYTVHISRVFVGLAGTDGGKRLTLVDRFGMRVVVGKRVQAVPDVPKLKIMLECTEVINVRLSPTKVAELTKIARSLDLPNLNQSRNPVSEIIESFEKCAFVHAVPMREEQSLSQQDEESLIFEEQLAEEGNVDGNATTTDMDASSEFFSVADDFDERASFMSRSQRFFDALNGDDAQSEARTKASTKKKATVASFPNRDETDRGPANGGVPKGSAMSAEDDMHSFFTADSSIRRQRQQQRLLRRASMQSVKKDEHILHFQARWIGLALHYSTISVQLPSAKSSLALPFIGSPVSTATFKRALPFAIRRNGSSQVSAAVATPIMENRELPAHVRSWLDELRKLEGDETNLAIAPLPTASPPPLATVSSHTRRRHTSLGGGGPGMLPSSTASSSADSVGEDEDELGSLMDDEIAGSETFFRKERTALIFRVDKIAIATVFEVRKRTIEVGVGHIILEEVAGGEGEDEIFSRFLLHTGLRLDEHDKLSYFGEDEEPVLTSRLSICDTAEAQTELLVTVNRSIDVIINHQVLRDTVIPLMNETFAAVTVSDAPVPVRAPSASLQLPFARTTGAIVEVRWWLVDENHLPFAMVKASRLDLTVENVYDGSVKAQGRIFSLDGQFFGDSKETTFLSRKPETDDNLPLFSLIGVRQTPIIERSETPIAIVPIAPPSPTVRESDAEVEEEIVDQVIDSILGTHLHRKDGPPSPISPVRVRPMPVVSETYRILHRGDELFINVLPLRVTLFGSFMRKLAHFAHLVVSITSSSYFAHQPSNGTENSVRVMNPICIRLLWLNPVLEFVDEDDPRRTITIGCSRLEGGNRVFQSAAQPTLLMERLDLLGSNSFVNVNGQHITSEGFEYRARMTDNKSRFSISDVDLGITQEQVATLRHHLLVLLDVAAAMPSSRRSGSSTRSSVLIMEAGQINISLLNSLHRTIPAERRGLVGRPNSISTSVIPPRSSTPVGNSCVALLKLTKAEAKLLNYLSLTLSLESLSLQQGLATVRKNHFIQLVTLPVTSAVNVTLNAATGKIETISVRVASPKFVYVPETVRDILFFVASIPTAKGSPLPSKVDLTSAVPPLPSSRSDEENSGKMNIVPFEKVSAEIIDSELWLGGGSLSKSLLVTCIAKVTVELSAEPMNLNLSLSGCSSSIRKDIQLPMVSSVSQHHLQPVPPLASINAASSSILISSIEEEGAKRMCVLPFDVKIDYAPNSVLSLSLSPIRISASFEDVSSIATTLGDFAASLGTQTSAASLSSPATSASAKAASSKSMPISLPQLHLSAQSVEAVYLNHHNFPIVRLVVEAMSFQPSPSTKKKVWGVGQLTMRASHHFKRDWEVLMEDCTINAEVESLNRVRVFCDTTININLMQSLVDGRDAFQEESEKLRHFINHTGLSVKRVVDRFHQSVAETEEYFCALGDPIGFRLTSKSVPGRFWMLCDAVCPKRGKVIKGLAVSNHPLTSMLETPDPSLALSSVVVVYEAEASTSSFVLKSPLKVKNETTQPLELAVMLPSLSNRPSSSSLAESGAGEADIPSRSTTPDSSDTFAVPTPSGTPNPWPPQQQQSHGQASAGKRRPRRNPNARGGNYFWSTTLAPNESMFVPADTAQLILSGRHLLLARPHAQVSGAPDYAFAELRLSNSAQLNQKVLKKSIAFSDFGSFSSSSSNPRDQLWTSHYVVETRWTDPYSQCLIFSAPVVLTNYLNCATTYRLGAFTDSNAPRAEGQLPSGAELKWHGQPPEQSTLLRLALKIPGFDWSESVPIVIGLQSAAAVAAGELEAAVVNPIAVSGARMINVFDEQQKIIPIELKDDAGRILKVDATVLLKTSGRVEVTLSVPYWIVNNTDLPVLFASSVMETLGSRVSAGQTKTIAMMRRIRLMHQLEEDYRERQYRRRRNAHSRMLANRRILSATHAAPTGVLEILDALSTRAEEGPAGAGTGEGDTEFERELATTTMFSSHHVRIRFWDSRWSDMCFFDHANEQVIQCKQEWRVRDPAVTRAMYMVSVKVEQSKICANTKVVTLSPRFILVNALDRAIKVRQWRGNLGELAKSRSSLSSIPIFSGGRQAKHQKDRFASTRGSGIVSLNPGEHVPFHWRDKSGPRQVSACFDEFGWEWSSGIQIDDCVGEFCARLKNRHKQLVYILRVDVQMVDATVVVTFRPELPRLPPYRVDNLSLQTIRFRQASAPISSAETLLPYHSCAYTWDLQDGSAKKSLIVETLARSDELEHGTYAGEGGRRFFIPSLFATGFGGFRMMSPSTWFWARAPASRVLGSFSLDKNFGYLNSSLDQVAVALHADGPTRVLTISDARMPATTILSSSGAASGDASGRTSSKNDGPFTFEVVLNGIGVSLIEENAPSAKGSQARSTIASPSTTAFSRQRPYPTARRELLRVSLADVCMRAGVTLDGDRLVEMALGDLQIDNQLLKATYPVLLCSNRRELLFLNEEDSDQQPQQQEQEVTGAAAREGTRFLTAQLIRSNQVPTLDVLKTFRLRLAPIQLNLEAEIIQALLNFAGSVKIQAPSSTSLSASNSLEQLGQPTQARPLTLSTVSSGSTSSTSTTAARKFYVEDLQIDPIEVRVNVKGALALIGGSQWFGAHVEGASLYLREFRLQHSLLSASNPVAKRILAHYIQSLRRHWYVLISSVDLLGDPIGFLKTLWGGVIDAVKEVRVSVSWESGFSGFARGLSRGLWTLLRAAVVGFTSSIVNVSNGASAALISVSSSPNVESEFRDPSGLLEHVVQGLAGLVVMPSRGYDKEGGKGFAAGAIKGIVGVVARPLAGVLRLITRISESLRTAVDPTSKVNIIRQRTPRFLRSEQPLETFDSRRALGEEVLWTVGLGSDVWMDHAVISDKHLLVLTETRLVVVRTAHHHREFIGVVLSLNKVDFIIASIGRDMPATAVLHCLPLSREMDEEFRNGRFVGERPGTASARLNHAWQRRTLSFHEKTVECENSQVVQSVIELLNRWGAVGTVLV